MPASRSHRAAQGVCAALRRARSRRGDGRKLLVQPVERPPLRREPPVGEGRLRRDTRMVMPGTFTVLRGRVRRRADAAVRRGCGAAVGRDCHRKPPYAPLRRRFGAQRAVGDVTPFHLPRRGRRVRAVRRRSPADGCSGRRAAETLRRLALARVGAAPAGNGRADRATHRQVSPRCGRNRGCGRCGRCRNTPHFAQPRLATSRAVARHRLPVVGREAPVLPRCGKGVGRCLPPVRRFGGPFVPSTEADAVRRGCIERGVCGTPTSAFRAPKHRFSIHFGRKGRFRKAEAVDGTMCRDRDRVRDKNGLTEAEFSPATTRANIPARR